MTKIEFNKVSKSYSNINSKTEVIKNLSFELGEESFYCLFGPSGCGKTTLLNLISKIIREDSGSIRFSQENLRLGYVFQRDQLLPWRTVEQNLDLVIEKYEHDRNKRIEKVNDTLESVKLAGKNKKFPGELSGGERQRINLARAIIIDADIILMDEPLAHLDEITANKLRSQILSLFKKKMRLIIYVTHNIFEAIYLADSILIPVGEPIKQLKEIKIKHSNKRDQIIFEEYTSLSETRKTMQKILSNIRKD